MEHLMYDVMISYRWRQFSDPARALAPFFDELNVRAWLDVREIDQSAEIPRLVLEDALAEAVRGSRLVLFFETEDAMQPGPDREGWSELNWQIFKRQFAGEVLFVHPRTSFPNFIVSCSGDYVWFYNIPYLAYLIGIAVDRRERLEAYSVLEKSAALTHNVPILAEEGERCAKAELMIPLN